MTTRPEGEVPPSELETPLSHDDPNEPPADVPEAYAQVLLRLMRTDPESNIVFGNIPRGEAEEFAAAVTYAEFSGSPVILRYENMKNMAKRAEAGSLLDKILSTLKTIGKNGDPNKGSMFTRFRQG